MISLASDVAKIPAPYFNEASDLNFINGTWVYTYCTSWDERTEWPYSNIDKPTQCNMSYMTSKTPLDPDSWKYRGNYFKDAGENNVGPWTNNHTHLFKFKEKYVAGFGSAQIGTALVTTASDEVQVARSVIALQICWHLFRVAFS